MAEGKKCHVATFGCRVNQADSEGIAVTLAGEGYTASASFMDADVVVINSCTVTHRSDKDIRKLVSRVNRANPNAKVIVAGCYAQRDPDALVRLPGTSAVLGNSDAHHLRQVVQRLSMEAGPIVLHRAMDDVDDLPPVDPVAVLQDRTRPFVKIQDGCDARCTYCVIPQVRGPARSASAERVVESVRGLVAQGYREVVLAGIHLGTYAHETDTLESLVERILFEVQDLLRLRLSCIEPMAFPIGLADIAKDEPRLAPHFHLPLQAGHDRVLKTMARPYRASDYRAMIDAIRDRLPEACIGTDVIAGFPGETDEEFDETLRFCASVGVDYVHVFSYSDRPGVPSTRLRDKVEPRTIKDRAERLNQVSEVLWARFLDKQIGRTLSALTLRRDERHPDFIEALSDAYCPIRIDDTELLPNTPLSLRVIRREGPVLWGEPDRSRSAV